VPIYPVLNGEVKEALICCHLNLYINWRCEWCRYWQEICTFYDFGNKPSLFRNW